MISPSLLISIKPEFSNKIFSGEKTVELRKIRPKIQTGSIVFIYESSPTKALVGAFEVDRVLESTPDKLWIEVQNSAGVSKKQFSDYFATSSKAYGIFIKNFWRFDSPLLLSKIQLSWSNFHPPQSYRYISKLEADRLGIMTPNIKVAA